MVGAHALGQRGAFWILEGERGSSQSQYTTKACFGTQYRTYHRLTKQFQETPHRHFGESGQKAFQENASCPSPAVCGPVVAPQWTLEQWFPHTQPPTHTLASACQNALPVRDKVIAPKLAMALHRR